MTDLICLLLSAYVVVLFGRIIMSWFPIAPGSALSAVYGFLYTLTEPVLGPVRKLMPSIGAGGVGLDLSPIIVFLGIAILRSAIC